MASADLAGVGTDLAEIGLDAVLEDGGLIEQLPILKTVKIVLRPRSVNGQMGAGPTAEKPEVDLGGQVAVPADHVKKAVDRALIASPVQD